MGREELFIPPHAGKNFIVLQGFPCCGKSFGSSSLCKGVQGSMSQWKAHIQAYGA